ncbi:MAG: signal peptidase II [Clostridiaceae bacterium]|nr:signal peptidase II [Clostridiaceae bacterium]
MYWILLIAGLIGLDQWTKWFFLVNKDNFKDFEIIKGFFYLTYVENRGAAFGILQNFRWFFIILTVIALAVMVWYFIKNQNKMLRLSLSFIMAGAVGNFIDRLFRGFVVDFFDFYPFGYNFPVFNVADICVNIGVFFLLIYVLFIYKEQEEDKVSEDTQEVSGSDEK